MADSERQVLAYSGTPAQLAPIWTWLLAHHEETGLVATVDGFSDDEHAGTLPDEAAAAMNSIRERPTDGARGMAIGLDLDDADDRDLLRRFGPFSIHAEVTTQDGRDLFGVHDGATLWVEGTTDELDEVATRLQAEDVTDLEPEVGTPPTGSWLPLAAVALAIAAAVALVVVGLAPLFG